MERVYFSALLPLGLPYDLLWLKYVRNATFMEAWKDLYGWACPSSWGSDFYQKRIWFGHWSKEDDMEKASTQTTAWSQDF